MTDFMLLRLVSVAAVALIYMLFDLLNKRNIPTIIAYATLAYGALLTVMLFNLSAAMISTLIAVAILGFGYFVYKLGQLGAADVIEFAAIALILPVQSAPMLLGSIPQLGLPFVLSVFIATGISALIFASAYYLPKARGSSGKPILQLVRRSDILKGILFSIAYAALMLSMELAIHISVYGMVVLLALLLGSFFIAAFNRPIAAAMVKDITPRQMENGDMIAVNMMDKALLDRVGKRVRGFGRLATDELIKKLRNEFPQTKFPVYVNAMPLALPIFAGVVASILFGNLILLVVY